MVEAQIEVMQLLQVKEHKDWQPDARKGFIRGFRGSMALPTPRFGAFSLQNGETINLCCFKPPTCHLLQ